jgi:hypothetical protein
MSCLYGYLHTSSKNAHLLQLQKRKGGGMSNISSLINPMYSNRILEADLISPTNANIKYIMDTNYKSWIRNT